MPQTLNFPIITHWANNSNQGQTILNFEVLRLSSTQNGYVTSKYASILKFPYYHSLKMWLLRPTNGNQGQIMKDLGSSETSIHLLYPFASFCLFCASLPHFFIPLLCSSIPFYASSAPLHPSIPFLYLSIPFLCS